MTDIDNNEEYDEREMGFLDHLEELRWRIIKALIGVVLAGIVVGIFADFIVANIILAPSAHTIPPLKIINIKPFGQFTLYMEVILIGGMILSIPNIIYQFWKFIEPALKPSERKYISAIVIFTSFCFLAGIVFAYFVMLPTALGFLSSFGTTMIENSIAIDEYVSFVVSMCLAAGIVFELPMVSFFLSKIGILKPQYMRKYRKHALIVILILSGILTPSPDITSMLLLAGPLFVLYEISIIISKLSQKKTAEDLETKLS
jgi:sec-independent protein translocase protein TatC